MLACIKLRYIKVLFLKKIIFFFKFGGDLIWQTKNYVKFGEDLIWRMVIFFKFWRGLNLANFTKIRQIRQF